MWLKATKVGWGGVGGGGYCALNLPLVRVKDWCI